MHDTALTWVEFSRTFINTVANWSEMKTCQTGYSVNHFFFSSFSSQPRGSIFQTSARKTEMEWQIIVRLIMVSRLLKTDCKVENWAERILMERRKKRSNRSSGVQIPWDIWTRFSRYLYFTERSWTIKHSIFSNKTGGFLIFQQITTADVVYKRLQPAGHQEIRPSRVFVYLIDMRTFSSYFLPFR